MLFAACQDKGSEIGPATNPPPKENKVTLNIEAQPFNAPARATLLDNYAMEWSVGEEIGILTSLGAKAFKSTDTGSTAPFEAVLADGETIGNLAIYPYGNIVEVDGEYVTINIPSEYDVDGSIYPPMIGEVSEDKSSVSMTFLGGALLIDGESVPDSAAKIVVSTTSAISGEFTLGNATAQTLSATPLAETQDADAPEGSVTLNIAPDADLTGAKLFVPILFGSYYGYTVTVLDAEGAELLSHKNTEPVDVGVGDLFPVVFEDKGGGNENDDTGTLRFKVEVVGRKSNDLMLNIDDPDGLPRNPDYPDDPISYIVRWAPVSEIGSLTDAQLFERELAQFAADDAEYADMSWWSYEMAVSYYTLLYGDQTNASLKGLASQVKCPIKADTEYEIYVYAVEVDEEAKTCRLLTEIERVRAATLPIQMAEGMTFTFGMDRVAMDAYGLSAYPSVTPDEAHNDQCYTFYCISEENLQYVAENFTEMNDEVAKSVLQQYIDSNNNPWWPTDPAEWTYFGYGYVSLYSAISVETDSCPYYIIAAAINEDLVICSEVAWEKFDVAGLTSTEDKMNLSVAAGAETDSYVVGVSPEGVSQQIGYITTVITKSAVETWLKDNNYVDTDVRSYVNNMTRKEIDALGGANPETSRAYLAAHTDYRTGVTTIDNIVIAEPTYVLAYTLFEKSGAVNGLQWQLLEPTAATAATVEPAE